MRTTVFLSAVLIAQCLNYEYVQSVGIGLILVTMLFVVVDTAEFLKKLAA